jgi:hypothetical protein
MDPSPPQAPPAEEASLTLSTGGTLTLLVAVIPLIFALVFHAGAAYMSYQRNQSVGWAFLHFFLAVFYYPYYAFTQSGAPAPAPGLMQSAGRRMKSAGKR